MSEWVKLGERVLDEYVQDNGNHPETLFRKMYVDLVDATVKRPLGEEVISLGSVRRAWSMGEKEAAGNRSAGSLSLCPYVD